MEVVGDAFRNVSSIGVSHSSLLLYVSRTVTSVFVVCFGVLNPTFRASSLFVGAVSSPKRAHSFNKQH
jgi:hypothetical protein